MPDVIRNKAAFLGVLTRSRTSGQLSAPISSQWWRDFIQSITDAGSDLPAAIVAAGGGGGGGEANTASNLGGGLANFDSKLGVDLRFNSFNAADFSLAANLLSILDSGIDHGSIGGLTDDDHTAYWRIPGRVGETLTVRDAGATNTLGVAVDATNAVVTHTNGATGFVDFSDTMVRVLASSNAFAPHITIEAVNPRFDMVDTTPINGDTWVFQVTNNNFRIRNLSNGDGELRLEESLNLNRFYDPVAGSNIDVVEFTPTFDTTGFPVSFSPNFLNISPSATLATNFNIVVLRGAGNYTQSGGTIFTYSMFRASPSINTSTAGQPMCSPNIFDNQTIFRVDGGVACLRNARYVAFHDRGSIEVDDPAGTETLMNEYTSFLAQPNSVNDAAGLISITDIFGLKVSMIGLTGGFDTGHGVQINNLGAPVVENIGLEIAVQNNAGSGFSKEVFLSGAGAIYWRETAGGVGINSPATDDMRIFAAADVVIDSANLGFYGAPAVVQAADPGALTDSTGGTANNTVVAVPPVNGSGATTAQEAAINDNFADLIDQINQLSAMLSEAAGGVGVSA